MKPGEPLRNIRSSPQTKFVTYQRYPTRGGPTIRPSQESERVKMRSILSQRERLAREIQQGKDHYTSLRREQTYLSQRMQATQQMLAQLQQELDNLPRVVRLKITDHAIVRYLERIEGFDMDQLRSRILPPTLEEMLVSKALTTLPIHTEDGQLSHILKVHDNVITTVFTMDMR